MGWVRRFVRFHGRRHPDTMGEVEVSRFISSLATERAVSASTQNQALAALLFLYREVLGRELERLGNVTHARRPVRLPVVMTREEVALVLGQLHGTVRLIASLLYGAGLRLEEGVGLRVKDVDFASGQVMVRRGKGQKDRVALLPQTLTEPLRAQLVTVQRLHEADKANGAGFVELPDALRAKYPNAGRDWSWQWVFPATRLYRHVPTGERRRHHLHETAVQRAVHEAVRVALSA